MSFDPRLPLEWATVIAAVLGLVYSAVLVWGTVQDLANLRRDGLNGNLAIVAKGNRRRQLVHLASFAILLGFGGLALWVPNNRGSAYVVAGDAVVWFYLLLVTLNAYSALADYRDDQRIIKSALKDAQRNHGRRRTDPPMARPPSPPAQEPP